MWPSPTPWRRPAPRRPGCSGFDDRGALAPGRRADLVALEDEGDGALAGGVGVGGGNTGMVGAARVLSPRTRR